MEQTTEKKQATFSVGDAVTYRAEGVCDVVDIRKECFGARGEGEDYYILVPRNDVSSSIYVPLHNEALTALIRPLLSREGIAALVREICNERMEWLPESRARHTMFREILSRGERRELALLVVTVSERVEQTLAEGKKPGSTETGALSRACHLLRDEFSVAVSLRSDSELVDLLRGEREI